MLTKIDLVPHLDVSVEQAIDHARSINPELAIFPTSSYTDEGLDAWVDWLREQVERRREGMVSAGAER